MTSGGTFPFLGFCWYFLICSVQEGVVCSECCVWDLLSAQWGFVLEVTLLLCWLIPRLVTGGCARFTACDSVDMIGDWLVPLKVFSVRVCFVNLQAADCQASCCLSHITWKGRSPHPSPLRRAALPWQHPALRSAVIVLHSVSLVHPSSSIFPLCQKSILIMAGAVGRGAAGPP